MNAFVSAKNDSSNMRPQQKRSLVFRHVMQHGPTSRSEIVHTTGLTQATVSRIVKELLDFGLLLEGPAFMSNDGPGRPNVELRLNPNGAFVIGLCLTASISELSIANLEGRRVSSVAIPNDITLSPQATCSFVSQHVHDMLADHKIPKRRVFGVGIGVAGQIDHRRGIVIEAPLLGWNNFDIATALRKLLRKPCHVDNVGNAIALCQVHELKESGANNLYLVHVGVGIGASLVMNGHLVRPHDDEAALSHIPVPGNEIECECGLKGCLTTLVSGRAIVNSIGGKARNTIMAGRNTVGSLEVGKAIELSNSGNKEAADAFYRAGTILGQMVISVIATLFPNIVLLSGLLSKCDAYNAGFRQGINEHLSPAIKHKFDIRTNDFDYLSAVERLAYDEFVFTDDFALKMTKSERRR